jgi:pimeloyl-ACP methyl ester carboxylesterase
VPRRDIYVTAADGTRLYADDRGPLASLLTPVVCLPGLTRNSRDFEPVFDLLEGRRRVVAMDLRGRGRSDRASDPSTYTPTTELQDVLTVLDHLQLERVALIGTSRGGIIGMAMAAVAKQRLVGLLLNDIGGQIEAASLQRIAERTGLPVHYANWDEAAEGFARSAVGFAPLPHEVWLKVVKRIYHESGVGIVENHDLALAKTLSPPEKIAAGKPAELWPLVPGLTGLPLALLRGEGSDLLSVATVERMQAMLPDIRVTKIPGRGHVPFLDEAESIAAIEDWLSQIGKEKGQ